jgi:Family of unknown function (DUF6529)
VSEAVARRGAVNRLLLLALAGAAVSLFLGVYANAHDPTGEKPYTLWFTGTINLKVWFASAAVVLALVQLLSALRLYGRLSVPREAPPWLGDVHRLSGTLAFAFSLPVAYHCLWALGFQTGSTRVLLHSLLGCFFYGVFVTKVLAVRSRNLPGWALPVIGGLVFTTLVSVWLSSAVWWWANNEFPGF